MLQKCVVKPTMFAATTLDKLQTPPIQLILNQKFTHFCTSLTHQQPEAHGHQA